MSSQIITVKTKDGVPRQYSIDEVGNGQYIVDLHEGSIYDGKPAVFNSPDDAFLFVLKIMSWGNSPIDLITSGGTFLNEVKIIALCQNSNITVNCY